MNRIIFLTVLIMLSIQAFTQEIDCKLKSDRTDEFTGKIERSTAHQVIGKMTGMRKLKASIIQNGDTYSLLVTANDKIGCSDSNSLLSIKFKDGQVINLRYNGDPDCGKMASLMVPIDRFIDVLYQKEVSTARLTLDAGSLDFDGVGWAIRDLIKCVNSKYETAN
jgi:hypothetical protein